jgi:hypothetical protein
MASRGDPETGDSGIIRLPAGHRSGRASEDWEVVAKALDHRLDELGWTQTVLAQRSRVSSATIRELLHGAERRRNARTLQDVSIALGWYPDHLGAILHGQPPPPPDLPGAGGKPVQEHLEAISIRLDQLAARLAVLSDTVELVDAKLSPRPTKSAMPRVGGLLAPVPVNKTDVRRFAGKHGYTMERAGRVWNTLHYTHKHQAGEDRRLPTIHYLGFAGQPYGDRDERVIDLRSVHERLVASKCVRGAWWRATKADITFLVHLVNDYMGLDTPLRA